jgi:hypothetical protein
MQELDDAVTKNKEYKETPTVNDDDTTWESWRIARGKLMLPLLQVKGITIVRPTARFVEANPHITHEALTYYAASSFLLYHARQIQREKTGKDLPPLQID